MWFSLIMVTMLKELLLLTRIDMHGFVVFVFVIELFLFFGVFQGLWSQFGFLFSSFFKCQCDDIFEIFSYNFRHEIWFGWFLLMSNYKDLFL